MSSQPPGGSPFGSQGPHQSRPYPSQPQPGAGPAPQGAQSYPGPGYAPGPGYRPGFAPRPHQGVPSYALPPQAFGPGSQAFWQATPEERTLAMWTWVGSIFIGWLMPLIIFLTKKDESPFVRETARQSLNFQIVMTIGMTASYLLMFVFIGFVTLPAIVIFTLIICILGAMKANAGEGYRPPLAFDMVK